MDNYYEVENITQASEIKNAYEEVIKANVPKYRAKSKTNKYYGWDENTNKFIRAEKGQEWFDNPHYVAPIEEVIDEIEPVEEPVPEEDTYKLLYAEKCSELENVNAKLNTIESELENVKQVAASYKAENDELKNGLSMLKTLLNKI